MTRPFEIVLPLLNIKACAGESVASGCKVRLPPPATTGRLVRVVVGASDGALDRWTIDRVAVVSRSIFEPPAPLPAAVFAATAMGIDLDVPLMICDDVSAQATLLCGDESRITLDVIVRPDEVLAWCVACGASLWSDNDGRAGTCGRCGGYTRTFEP